MICHYPKHHGLGYSFSGSLGLVLCSLVSFVGPLQFFGLSDAPTNVIELHVSADVFKNVYGLRNSSY